MFRRIFTYSHLTAVNNLLLTNLVLFNRLTKNLTLFNKNLTLFNSSIFGISCDLNMFGTIFAEREPIIKISWSQDSFVYYSGSGDFQRKFGLLFAKKIFSQVIPYYILYIQKLIHYIKTITQETRDMSMHGCVVKNHLILILLKIYCL
jgi:hypothetical protein